MSNGSASEDDAMAMGGEAYGIDAGDEEKGSAHLLRLASLQRLLLLLLLEGVERVPVPRVRYRRLHHRPHLHRHQIDCVKGAAST